jgi:hypothetical protein
MEIFKTSYCREMLINRFFNVATSIGLPSKNDPIILKMKNRDIFAFGNPNLPTLWSVVFVLSSA